MLVVTLHVLVARLILVMKCWRISCLLLRLKKCMAFRNFVLVGMMPYMRLLRILATDSIMVRNGETPWSMTARRVRTTEVSVLTGLAFPRGHLVRAFRVRSAIPNPM